MCNAVLMSESVLSVNVLVNNNVVLHSHEMMPTGSGTTQAAHGIAIQEVASPDTSSGLEVIKLEFILRLKIKRNDWLLVDTCLQAANHCALF